MTDELQTLLDRQAIVDLTIAYAWILDHGPRDRLTEVFTQDVHAVLVGNEFNGVDEFIAKVKRALGPLSISQHMVSNQQVQIDGDTATCRCYLQAQHTVYGAEGGENYIMAGRYEDHLVRTPDGWRIADRTLTIDWTEGNPDIRQGA